MVGFKVAVLLFGLAAASALPQPADERWGDQPSWWPDSFPWPPALPDQWPDRPEWWPDSLAWPPAIPDQWPDRPEWWPDCASWPPAVPEQLPPNCWPEHWPWPPALPEQWPDQPSWWPDVLPWPPALPDQWPDRPQWWPEALPWPPALPEDIPWPPPGVDTDRIPYIPSRDNQFHLFTRNNQYLSQPLIIDNANLLSSSNYNAGRRTVILVHGYQGSATAAFNAVLVPAFLAADDVNVIIVDWSKGANSHVALSTFYSVLSGNFVARFTRWLTQQSGANLADFHIVGLGLGGLNAGFISRRLNSEVGYVTALDPSGVQRFTGLLPPLNPTVAQYTEVIHTDVQGQGYRNPLGDVDFYPNGGGYMPGCGGDSECNRNRAVYYFAESIQTGGFTGIECASHHEALSSSCNGAGRLNLGGLAPKTGSKGVYWVGTNASPPFSQG
ncbi:lipase member I-like [Ostrinia nubilalis]|uniref:lipase member I-like n=1 Tax=Ostrinia nubilalis TaxID=29057 RepID=UPI0030825696